ncbi:LuxR C-terminal-related transcriptional regulator [Rhodococcus sp. Z13]|uniref:LuxR C-terminal-related transcriptional regulator n=1 Tax=Rhodococcus sacchari TaxID=2962047 RepID=A0ACD4DEL5_9NOCA|nr:LuxR C-terminal-related transcriptional regulator [Rhodococcus sp. Z13]UYP18436.1 LuxR C-terminal-related transcriptional regulator [Rhodococcus sp. Z13]
MTSAPSLPQRPVPREVTRVVSATAPPSLLLVGGAGTGKSAVLASLRERIGAARVVDDAHRLTAGELDELIAGAAGAAGLVVATEPRPHRPEIRALAAAFAAHGSVVELRNWTARETAGRAASFGLQLAPPQVRSLHRLTGGVPALVDTALDAVRTETDVRRAVAERIRMQLATDRDLAAVLALVELGVALDPGEVAAVLDLPADRALDLVDTGRASGLLDPDENLVPGAAGIPAAAVGRHGLHASARRLLSTRLEAGTLTPRLARSLAGIGLTDPHLADHLVALAAGAAPGEAADLLDAAITAGADPAALAVPRAEVAFAAGDLTTAAQLADRLLERCEGLDVDDVRAATRISASVAAQRGMLDRSADLFEWLGPDRAGGDAPIAAAVLLAAGRPDAARHLRSAVAAGAPTSSVSAARLVEEGLRESVGGDGRVAMNRLTRALTSLDGETTSRAWPDGADAIAALLCLHSGELDHARALLARPAVPTVRNRLLAAWADLLGGDLAAATTAAERLAPEVSAGRDLLFLHALQVGLARRSGDLGALTMRWRAAQGVVAEYSVDLFGLLPLGELWLAAVRVGEPDRVAHLVADARRLLATLGEPPLWGAALHWYGVQAAIAANRPSDLVPHARALALAAESTAYAAVLARAGQAWLGVLRGDVDTRRVREAAEALAAVGLPWDGAKLAGEAALRAEDTAAATGLLQIARDIRQNGRVVRTPADTPPSAPDDERPSAPTVPGPLSEREAQVADLVVSGLTYREVGNHLYISAKTVEHHVARIRRRLGAGSRSELLSLLRAMGHGTDAHRHTHSDGNGGTPACP